MDGDKISDHHAAGPSHPDFFVFPACAILNGAWSFSGSGSGTVSSPYVISNATQLQEMKDDLTAHYVLGNDIDASETSDWNGGAGFEAIGDPDNPFSGSLDGQSFAVSNFFINRPSSGFLGLFGYFNGATIESVRLTDCSVSGSDFLGGLVGHLSNGRVFNCRTTGAVDYRGAGIHGGHIDGLIGGLRQICGFPEWQATEFESAEQNLASWMVRLILVRRKSPRKRGM